MTEEPLDHTPLMVTIMESLEFSDRLINHLTEANADAPPAKKELASIICGMLKAQANLIRHLAEENARLSDGIEEIERKIERFNG